MRITISGLGRMAALAGGLCLPLTASRSLADDAQAKPDAAKSPQDVPAVSLLDAMHSGDITVSAEGSGDGRMTLSLTNKSKRQLRVVLPPGLIASGASGQFGGMGGMGGGMMGGMGGMGGMGMGGGMMGGMGGMGGMGMMGGGMMGGRGGMMGGGMMGGGTMPASMGMMMLGRLIMTLVGERDSWNMMSLMGGMMGGMGMMGGGMGMMGGGMGMMGGGMMGGMGGGFRSVPPTSLPFTTLKPKQTRHLPTRLVGIAGPGNDVPVAMPAKGEKLRIGDIDHATRDERVRTALKRLAADKAPQNISQLVMWNVAGHLDWGTIAARSKGWANRQELTLARQMVERLDRKTEGETGVLLYEINAADGGQDAASALSGALKDKMVLGLKAESGVPAHPEGPAVACKVRVNKGDATVQVGISDGTGQSWTAAGKFTVPLTRDKDKLNTTALVDALAEGILDRLVRVQIAPGPRVKGKPSFKLKIENASPLVLNGLAVLGRGNAANEVPKVLSGICIAPSRSMTVPASEEMVKGLGLRKGVRVIAADLSGL